MSGNRPSIDDLLERARVSFEQGDAETALEWATKAAEQQPDHPRVLSAMGAILGSHGLIEQAEGYFRRALSADPEYVDAYLNLTRIQLQWGRYGEARRTFAQFRRSGLRFTKEAMDLDKALKSAPKGSEQPPEMLTSLERAISRWPEITATCETAVTFVSPGSRALVTGELALLVGNLLIQRDVDATCLVSDTTIAGTNDVYGPEVIDRDLWVPDARRYHCILNLGLSPSFATGAKGFLAKIESSLLEGGTLILSLNETWSKSEEQKLIKLLNQASFAMVESVQTVTSGGLNLTPKDSMKLWVLQKSVNGESAIKGFAVGKQEGRPVALFCDWRRSCGHGHGFVRQALAGFGYAIIDPTLGELEELNEECDADDGLIGLDIDRIVESARIREYGSASIDAESTREHLKERFCRIVGLLQKAVFRFRPNVIVTGDGWLETWAARQVALDHDIHHLILNNSTFKDRCSLTLTHGGIGGPDVESRAHFEWRRWKRVSEFDYGRVVGRLNLDDPRDKDTVDAQRQRLKIDTDKRVVVAVIEPERHWLGTPGMTHFTSALHLAEKMIRSFARQTKWHLIVWTPESDVDGGEESFESRLRAKKLIGRRATLVTGESEGHGLSSLSQFMLTTGLERSFPWLVQDKPVISVVRCGWSNLGFTREAIEASRLRDAVKEAIRHPTLNEEERRLAKLFLQDYAEETLVEINYGVIREALAQRLSIAGALTLPVAGQQVVIQDEALTPK